MLEYELAFARVRVNLSRVEIQIQPVTGFYLQHSRFELHNFESNKRMRN